MKKRYLILILLLTTSLLSAYDKTSLFENFASRNNMTYMASLQGHFSSTSCDEFVIFMEKSKFDTYAYYLIVDNNSILDSVFIKRFWHTGNGAISESLKTKSKEYCKFGFISDSNKDGFDEIYLDYSGEGTFPIILGFDNSQFVSLCTFDGFPISHVITPGAPNIYETFRLVDIEDSTLYIIRTQSDLDQHLFYTWSDSEKQFIDITNDYFSTTGFGKSGNMDFDTLNSNLTREILSPLTSKQLRLLRNAIYARYGFVFHTWDLVDDFSQCKWYKENSDFTEDQLTEIDKQNIRLIQEFECEKGVFKPIDWDLFFDQY